MISGLYEIIPLAQEARPMLQVSVLRIDLAKQLFHLVAVVLYR